MVLAIFSMHRHGPFASSFPLCKRISSILFALRELVLCALAMVLFVEVPVLTFCRQHLVIQTTALTSGGLGATMHMQETLCCLVPVHALAGRLGLQKQEQATVCSRELHRLRTQHGALGTVLLCMEP